MMGLEHCCSATTAAIIDESQGHLLMLKCWVEVGEQDIFTFKRNVSQINYNHQRGTRKSCLYDESAGGTILTNKETNQSYTHWEITSIRTKIASSEFNHREIARKDFSCWTFYK